jgi:hypothetical protein
MKMRQKEDEEEEEKRQAEEISYIAARFSINV